VDQALQKGVRGTRVVYRSEGERKKLAIRSSTKKGHMSAQGPRKVFNEQVLIRKGDGKKGQMHHPDRHSERSRRKLNTTGRMRKKRLITGRSWKKKGAIAGGVRQRERIRAPTLRASGPGRIMCYRTGGERGEKEGRLLLPRVAKRGITRPW